MTIERNSYTTEHGAELPQWLKPGSTVFVITGGGFHTPQITETSVDRILKRDIVLANGRRFRVRDVRWGRWGFGPDAPVEWEVRHRGGDWGHGSFTVLPPGHPRLDAVRRQRKEQRLRNDVYTASGGGRPDRLDLDGLRALWVAIEHLQDHLAEEAVGDGAD